MAITRHATSSVAVSGNGATSNSVTWPTNSVDDIAILAVASTVNIATPTGWTLIASDTAVTNGQIFVFWQHITSVQSGSFTLTQPSGITQIAITTYSGCKTTAPATGEYIMHRMGINTTAISTQTAITFATYGLQVVVGPPAFNISTESCSGTGWTMSEAYDSIFGGVPSLAMADGPMSTGGSGKMTAIGGGSVNWAILGLALEVSGGGTTTTSITKSAKYTVLTTPAAKTKSAKYTIKTTPTAKTKSAQYAIKRTTAVTKSAAYHLFLAGQSVAKSAQYRVSLGSLSLTKSARYAVKTQVGKTLTAIYDIFNAGVAITKSAQYVVSSHTTTTSISNGFSGTVTKTWSHTVNETHPLLVLTADIWQDVAGTGSITAASFNGVALTQITTNRSVGMASELWYLAAPSAGAHTMSVTITGNTDAIKLSATSFPNIAQSNPLDASNTATGTSGNPSASVTTLTANALIVATLSRFSTTAATSNQTALFNDTTGSILGAASYQTASAVGSYTDTYTGSVTDDWSMAIASFKPFGSTTTTSITKAATYDILTTPSALTKSATYRLFLGSTAITKPSRYALRKTHALTKGAIYEVIRHPAITKSARYAIKKVSLLSKPSRYAIKKSHAITKSARYSIKTGHIITKSATYRIYRGTVAITKSAAYAIDKGIALTQSAKYAVKTTHTITKTASYSLAAATFLVTKTAKYAVKTSHSLTRSAKYEIVKHPVLAKSSRYAVKVSQVLTKAGTYILRAFTASEIPHMQVFQDMSSININPTADTSSLMSVTDVSSIDFKKTPETIITLNNPPVLGDSSTVLGDSATVYGDDSYSGETPQMIAIVADSSNILIG